MHHLQDARYKTHVFLSLLFLTGCTGEAPGSKGQDSAPPSAGPAAIVATTDFSVGALARIDTETWEIADTLTATSADPSIHHDEGLIFLVNGYNADSLRVYDPDDLSHPGAEISTGAGTNPHDVEICNGRAFVSLYETTRIAVYDLQDWTDLDSVDLSDHVDDDGVPEVSDLVELNGTLYAALQHFDRNSNWTAGVGEIVEINCETGRVTQSWEVGASPRIYPHPTRPQALLVLTGTYWQADGGLFVLDVEEGLEPTPVLSEQDVQMDLPSLATSPTGHALLIASGFETGAALICLDLVEGTWSKTEESDAWYARIHASPDGEAWVSARPSPEETRHGLVVMQIDSCTSRTGSDWLTLTLPPYGVAFVE